jgi:hypothetical protein
MRRESAPGRAAREAGRPAREGPVIERILGNFWVTVIAFIVGPAILIWMQVRKRRLAEGGKGGAKPAAPAAPKPAPVPASAGPDADISAVRKPLWPGFRGIRWGDPPAPGMAPIHEEGDSRFLVRGEDDLKVGHVMVSSIVYSFRIGRLEAVVIDLPVQGFEALVRYLTSEFGTPKSSPDRTKHSWADTGSGPEASQAVIEKRAEARSARLVLSSRAALAARTAKPAGA